MDPRDEDELWKEIVENYGDVPSVEDPPEPSPGVRISFTLRLQPPTPDPEPDPEPEPDAEPDPDPLRSVWEGDDRFVPPPPPPVPAPEPGRLLAWLGLFGAPLLMLVALVAGRPFRGIWAVLLAAAFVGGFVYLVKTMSDEPRRPGDDGARL
ncbi:hypothetical protein [Nocardioides sp. AE5]|uniref:hypothetical protein n=1 Tax=Nocardioides sp. AE5 TaxID=2962573 RepID=UPI002880E6A1|nr:hypothetical protein [Nocardioides sp. AE5]MDT0201212.1 hypothetical protein [Nocardioides sp. AE5]